MNNSLLCGDLKFISAWMGHQGCASTFPCSLCRANKNSLHSIGELRTFGQDEAAFSCTAPPLLILPVIPPPLHIIHGLIGKALDISQALVDKEYMNTIYKRMNILPDPRTKKFCGFLHFCFWYLFNFFPRKHL